MCVKCIVFVSFIIHIGVVPNYADYVVELVSGPCLALEIRAEDAVNTFRVTCGPWDVNMAKELRPGKFNECYNKKHHFSYQISIGTKSITCFSHSKLIYKKKIKNQNIVTVY